MRRERDEDEEEKREGVTGAYVTSDLEFALEAALEIDREEK